MNFKVSTDVYLMYGQKRLVNLESPFKVYLSQKKTFVLYSHHKNQKIGQKIGSFR